MVGTDVVVRRYLVDFENVGTKGLKGISTLKGNDRAIIFYTSHLSKKIRKRLDCNSFRYIEGVKVIEGRESVDKHILAYMGYLMAEKSENYEVYVVSNDRGYDRVIEFMNRIAPVWVQRVNQIKHSPEDESEYGNLPYNKSSKMIEQETIKWLRFAGFVSPVTTEVAEIVCEAYGKIDMSNQVMEQLKSNYDNYDEVYDAIKPLLVSYVRDTINIIKQENESIAVKKEEKIICEKIQNKLLMSGYSREEAIHSSDIALKSSRKKDNLYWTHRMLVREYGQDKGAEIYRKIKKIIR